MITPPDQTKKKNIITPINGKFNDIGSADLVN
jgi:hypothetical protein